MGLLLCEFPAIINPNGGGDRSLIRKSDSLETLATIAIASISAIPRASSASSEQPS